MYRNNLYVFLFFAGLLLVGVPLYMLHTRLPAGPGQLKANNTEAHCSLVFGALMAIIGAIAWYINTYKVYQQIKRSSRELTERSTAP